MSKKLFFKILSFVLVLFIINFVLQNIFRFDVTAIRELVASFGYAAPIAYSLLLFLGLSLPFNPLSDYLVVFAAAFLFPPELAIGATFISHVFALTTNYWLGRIFGWRIIERFSTNQELSYLKRFSKQISISQVFAMRWILPLTGIGIDVVSYAAGLAKLRFYRFFFVSLVPWTVFNVVFFLSAGYITERSPLLFFFLGIFIASLTLLVFYPARKKFLQS